MGLDCLMEFVEHIMWCQHYPRSIWHRLLPPLKTAGELQCVSSANYYFIIHLLCFTSQNQTELGEGQILLLLVPNEALRTFQPVTSSCWCLTVVLFLHNGIICQHLAIILVWASEDSRPLLCPKAPNVQVNKSCFLSSRPVNCVHTGTGISETDVAGSNHVMNWP